MNYGNSSTRSLPSDRSAKLEEMRKIAGADPATIRSQIIASGASTSNQAASLLANSAFNYPSVTTSSDTSFTCTVTTSQASCASTSTYTVAARVGPNICSTTPVGNNSVSDTMAQMAGKAARKGKCSFQAPGLSSSKKRKVVVNACQTIRKVKMQATDLRKATPKVATASATATTMSNNRFAALALEADNVMEQDLAENCSNGEEDVPVVNMNRQSTNGPSKPPAICVPNVDNPHSLEQALNSCVGDNSYSIRTSKFGVSRIYTINADAFRAVVKHLTSLNCQFWHHQLREDKPYTVAVKGMHANVPKAQIEHAFADHGFEALNIYCPRKADWRNAQVSEDDDEATVNFKTRQNMFFVNLKQGPKIAEALKITQLGRYRVTVERAPRRREVLQCLRCHIFGHSKNYCVRDPICAKCAGSHMTGSLLCTSDICMCVNCGGDHASTDKDCPVRIEKLRKMKPSPRLPVPDNATNNKHNRASSARGFIPAEAVRGNMSYADIVRPKGSQFRATATINSQHESNPLHDLGSGNKFLTLEKSIREINGRMDQLFKLVQETVEANKAFRELVQVLISRMPK
uniref:Nucleic-acid-binding protein from mobile element jockey n=1 Tax=Drosophila funebris TaxID=7221 RepID=GAGJ_DROFU|nr:RecName: Full=Nucleic-acid-binding protein from mobile element jockey; AltName: Full=ORF1 [Drosophila funebris]AAA28648.1 ORF1; putative [Drosophila funebris]